MLAGPLLSWSLTDWTANYRLAPLVRVSPYQHENKVPFKSKAEVISGHRSKGGTNTKTAWPTDCRAQHFVIPPLIAIVTGRSRTCEGLLDERRPSVRPFCHVWPSGRSHAVKWWCCFFTNNMTSFYHLYYKKENVQASSRNTCGTTNYERKRKETYLHNF